MIDIILDTLIDILKLIPFLFFAFLIIEVVEHKLGDKTKQIISNSGNIGPFFGSLLGLFPQCGFSVMATNLYITRIITMGTLISIYLSTSDEMLPILISQKVDINIIIKILGIKFIVGIISGFIIDFIFKKHNKNNKITYNICEEEHCDCEHGIMRSSIKHTIKTLLFISIIIFTLNLLFEIIGEGNISKLFLKNTIFGPFISSIVGLIPNCGASIIITELYLNKAISLGSAMAGLLTGSGVAVLVLFKENKNIKENIAILGILYGIGVIAGITIDIFSLL